MTQLFAPTLSLILLPGLLLAFPLQDGRETREIQILKVEAEPVVDGVLDEAVWKSAPVARDFVQKDPDQGLPATEATAIKFIYTGSAVYFGVQCYDGDAAEIIATERRRDEDLVKDDSVAILLDTFHDHRNAFLFRINPLGTKFDAFITNEGRDINISWDERWAAEARIHNEGWTAEIMIPFGLLRVPDQDTQVWGLDFERIIRRKNEVAYWNAVDILAFAFQQMPKCQTYPLPPPSPDDA